MRKLSEIDVNGKRVLMRLDLNVPLKDGKITSDARIQAALPTIRYVLDHGGAVMIMAHLGRPTEGEYDEAFSLAPVAAYLGNLLGKNVPLIKNYLDQAPAVAAGDIVMLENCRFNKGETKNTPHCATSSSATASASSTAPRPPPTVSPKKPKPPLPACSSNKKSKRWKKSSKTRRARCSPSLAAPKSQPNCSSSNPYWKKSIPSSPAAASPTPSSLLKASTSAPPSTNPTS